MTASLSADLNAGFSTVECGFISECGFENNMARPVGDLFDRRFAIYSILLLRLAAVFSPSYIHPDEFFQGPEVVAGWVFGLDNVLVPWEFNATAHARSPARSIVLPAIICGIPFGLAKAWAWASSASVNPRHVLYGPRIFLVVISWLVVDRAMMRIAAAHGVAAAPVLRTLSTSWAALVFLCRPFSNTAETILLACCLTMVTAGVGSRGSGRRSYLVTGPLQAALLGGLLVVGVFNRFTFLIFFLPIAADQALALLGLGRTPDGCLRAAWVVAGGTLGVLVFLTGLVTADSLFFLVDGDSAGEEATREASAPIVLTPLNSFLYNLNASHLATHGLHPWWLHSVVNLPLMFGPLAVAFYASAAGSLGRLLGHALRGRRDGQPRWSSDLVAALVWPGVTGASKLRLFVLCDAIVATALVLLSQAPHQEPRFLLPLVVPLVLRYSGQMWNDRLQICAWLVFNVIVGAFFGVLHQGGLIKAILRMHELNTPPNATAVFAHTLMVPRHLTPKHIAIVDNGGAAWADVANTLRSIASQRAYFVAPRTFSHGAGDLGFDLDFQYSAHLSMEDPPSQLSPLSWSSMMVLDVFTRMEQCKK